MRVRNRLYRLLLRTLLPFLSSDTVKHLTARGVCDLELPPRSDTPPEHVEFDRQSIDELRKSEPDSSTEPLRAIRVWEMNKVTIHSSQGVVFTGDGKLVAQSIQKRNELDQAALFKCYVPAHPISISGTCTTICANFNNYSHWITESLARLYTLSKYSCYIPMSLIVPDDLAAYKRRSLEYCLPDGLQIVTVPGESWISADHFVLPEFTRNCAAKYLPYEVLDYIREKVFGGVGLSGHAGRSRRIYLSRADITRSKGRRVLNEDEVISLLARFGFETLLPARLSYEDQVRLFWEAEMVVGPAGSALSNIIYGNKLKVIEFQIAPPQEYYYWRFSQVLGHEHRFLATNQLGIEDDFSINIGQLEKLVQTLLCE